MSREQIDSIVARREEEAQATREAAELQSLRAHLTGRDRYSEVPHRTMKDMLRRLG